ncbi:MAG TPA: Ig-like domain-containing protein [Verrucomicrobiae bacterium]|nr:Ig-like domain-containing protein [Verrucomicrobiae bacterium]
MRFGVFFVAATLVGNALAADYSIDVKWQTNSVEISGLKSTNAPDGKPFFSVYAEQGNLLVDANLPAMAGEVGFKDGVLIFTPRFPLQPGVKYRAVVRPQGDKALSFTHQFEAPELIASTIVAATYPAVDSLPENVLKFYIVFSAPMSGGHIYDYIHLRNAAGKDVQLPFLEIDEELWDPTMTRLTLFLDPGRIKRGVKPLEEIGPALEIEKSYTLWIARDWKDAKGAPLKTGFEKSFKVVAPDREPPNPLRWKITAPKSKTRDALIVAFDEPLDHALAQRVLRIADSKGALVQGTVKLDRLDQSWTFVPHERWAAGTHKLIVPTIIEDLAGNNIGKPFDVDLQERPRPMTNEVVRVSFTVR